MPKSSKDDREKAKKYERAKMLARERARRHKAKKTAAQLEKKREQDRIRAKEKRDQQKRGMTEKQQKALRKVWRDRKRNLRKKEKEREEMLANTPPESDEDMNLPQRDQSRQSEAGKKIVRRNRAKILKELKNAKDENKQLQKKLEKYKKRYQREKNKKKHAEVSPSPRKKLKQIIGTEKLSPRIRKQLFCGIVLEKQLNHQIQSTTPKSKLRQQMTKAVGNEFLKKYRLQKQFHSIVPYSRKKNLATKSKITLEYERKTYETMKIKESLAIRKFYESDTVSKMLPGKKDYVKRGKVKMQRRILLDSLYNLYDKFVEETNLKIVSRSVFYRCRPWWVFRPSMKDRETCACVKHENIEFIVSALKQAKVIEYKDIHEVVKHTVCSEKRETCMFGSCSDCKTKTIKFEIGENEIIKFHKWETVTEEKIIKGMAKSIKHVEKTTQSGKKSDVIDALNKNLPLFKKHVFNWLHQAKILKTKCENPNKNEICFQVDFSQNYVAKFATEIQSVHFGASQKQISLHTGARFVLQNDKAICNTFCTVSDNIDHHAHGVWSHLKPVLNDANEEFPSTTSVNIFSDSPSSQYRNKSNVFLMKHCLPQHFPNLETFSWNFSEPGHGKGIMDGVGGSIKRNADSKVLWQKDITCAKDLVQLFQKSKTKTVEVTSESFEAIKQLIPQKLDPIEGIMSVKQITWSKKTGILHFRRLSCFDCSIESVCSHFHLFSVDQDSKQERNKKANISTKSKQTRNSTKEQAPKKKLKVSDVYSSSDEDEVCIQEPVQLITEFSYDDFKQGRFLVVAFNTGNRKTPTTDYVAVIQSVDNIDERELFVMFLKKDNNDNSTFYPDAKDESTISVDEVKGFLPTPEMMFKGSGHRKRLYYKFSGPVPLS